VRSPWQVWLAFAVCLAMIVAAVGWLSFRALESDRAEATARQQAAAEENVRLALWRIDSKLAPLVTQESARPYFSYSTFFPVERALVGKGPSKPTSPEPIPSPLLGQLPPEVLLHFQIDAAGRFSSPRVPPRDLQARAVPKFLSADDSAEAKRQLDHAKKIVDRAKLLAVLPPPELPAPTQIAASNFNGSNTAQIAMGNGSRALSTVNPTNSANPSETNNYLNNAAPNGPPQFGTTSGLQKPTVQQAANPNETPQFDAQQEGQRQQRGANEYQARSQYLAQNMANAPPQNELFNWTETPGDERTAIMMPLWIDNRLILARRVEVGGKELIQGCLLDWPAIERELRAAIADLLPDAKLLPVIAPAAEDESRRSAVLPMRLEIGALPAVFADTLSPVRMSLVVAWSSLLLGAVAVALLLNGVLGLSERRAAFVSAVTHELRTPLTTFRMYAEMLAEGMVPDEASRHRYLDTLRIEADRLTHLVENVLAYSRLERSKPGRRVGPIAADNLLATAGNRLADRAAQAGFELEVEADDAVRQTQVIADAASVEQILFNLVDNACKYAATAEDRRLHLEADAHGGRFYLRLRDHGPGIDSSRRGTLFQAFRKSAEDAAVSAPGVGLGLALCRCLARDMGGDLRYEPQSSGACFTLSLKAVSTAT
jgi:signal transduction histidine kinase